ncbi:UNVERIFIED_CONTAM: hypothetical protein RF653_18995, partial [Kocuria sp. CPCC 205316]|uniref:hypothetical protein n=1 Tax=Kocuria sp. CPCC 205316 TaxID=3073559 RepID=UPI0036DA5FF2
MLNFEIPTNVVRACDACMKGKIKHMPFSSHFKPVSKPPEVVHADLVGPIMPATNSAARYFLTLVDQHTGYIQTVILKLKSNAKVATEECWIFFEKQTSHVLKKLISNGGGEFVNRTLSETRKEASINHMVSPPYTHQHSS